VEKAVSWAERSSAKLKARPIEPLFPFCRQPGPSKTLAMGEDCIGVVLQDQQSNMAAVCRLLAARRYYRSDGVRKLAGSGRTAGRLAQFLASGTGENGGDGDEVTGGGVCGTNIRRWRLLLLTQ
jgi:hypothetical protein